MFWNIAESTFPSLFLKLIIDVAVIVIRHLEIAKLSCPSLGFGETLLSASYNIFLMSVSTSMCDPFVAVEEEKTLCNEVELSEMREDTKKTEEHLYSVMSPAQFFSAVTAISLV